jgi:hypothetical protein
MLGFKGERVLKLLVFCLVILGCASAQTQREASYVVVLLQAQLAERDVFGAGLLLPVLKGGERHYVVVTANHLMRENLSEAANLSLEPLFATAQPVTATLTPDFDDALDIAVLSVDNASEFPPLNHRTVTEELSAGTPLRTIGQGGKAGTANIPETRAVLNYMDSQDIVLESPNLFAGDSGGGIFTEDWQLVGMLTQGDQITKGGVSLKRILEKLSRWGYEVDFEKREATTLTQSLEVSSKVAPGICVNPGDTVTVAASGSIIVGPVLGSTTPDGLEFPLSETYSLFPTFPHGALLCRLDTESFWRKCGSRATFEADVAGCLEFEVNDKEQVNNSGAFRVEVSVSGN